MSDRRHRIPGTDTLLTEPRLADAATSIGAAMVKRVIRQAQQRARDGEIRPDEVAGAVIAALPATATTLRPVINATGVLVHTNLGRAPLSAAATAALLTAAGSTDVEFDLATGRRARRGRGTLDALREAVPTAGDAHVVNNNAAALLLAALVLAPGKEIVISRGELVEIGDGFRIPELLESTGSRLREVGTTNRTSERDYADAVGERTGFVLKVHTSNFLIRGFTSEVPVKALAALDVPVVVDIGSGLLRPHPLLPDEPDATGVLRSGANLVTASADKLLGGPQAGLLLGDAELISSLRRHPAARALRVAKLTLAALEATLLGPEPPVVSTVDASLETLAGRAGRILDQLEPAGVDALVVPSRAAVGGGGAPGVELPSVALSLPGAYAARLRAGRPAVVGRIERDRCLLDLRGVLPDEDEALVNAVLESG